MNLYDQLLQLQVIPNAYKAWEQYRKHLTEYIITELESSQNVAILGVGRSNDIDLRQLLPYVKTLTLIDKDEKALEQAIKQYHLEKEDNIRLICRDLLGLTAQDYRNYANQLVETVRQKGMATDMQNLVEVAISQIEALSLKMQPIDLGKLAYDTVIVVGLHSQLLSMIEWIWQVILQTLGKDENGVREYIIDLNKEIIRALNQRIIEATTEKIIIGCEIQRVGRLGSIQGAIQSLQNIEDLRSIGKIKKCSECVLEWPFNQNSGMSYNILIQSDWVLGKEIKG